METSHITTQQLMYSLIEIWKGSGKSQKEFCQEKDIAYHNFIIGSGNTIVMIKGIRI